MVLPVSIITGLAILLIIIVERVRGYQVKQLQQKLSTSEESLVALKQTEQTLRHELNAVQAKLTHAVEDPVTNLIGWQLFEDRLAQTIRESARYELTMGVLFIDIDEFKVVNNALGYEVGDALLQAVAERLHSCIRQVDSISRFTKDTFVVLLTQLNKPETAALVAQRILSAFTQPFQIREFELYVTVCIGIAIYPTDGQDTVALLRGADRALRLAKSKGTQVYQFYQEKTHINSLRELALYNDLRRDTVYQEFQLYYQSVMNTKNGSVFCMDALLHWQHAELGLINPQELFGYIEKQRRVNPVTEWILQTACKQFQQWQSLGFNPDHIGIPVQLVQLESSQFIYRLSQILQELQFPPQHVLLEIRESSTTLALEGLEKAFNMLQYIGVKIAIQDFGAGMFSLGHLKHFPVNYLKLSPSLVDDIASNQRAQDLIKSLVYLTKTMSIELIVQGVEAKEQATILQELGCHVLQGQFFGVPLAGQEVADKMVAT